MDTNYSKCLAQLLRTDRLTGCLLAIHPRTVIDEVGPVPRSSAVRKGRREEGVVGSKVHVAAVCGV